ncbi:uncharacterized protein LOC143571830 [Bidens hawaiensis]|uniref:uncharacterized protein LOC143571830 n=1 Tax=Bidens hawaiensis TaxID=980011 RepID=UPI0040492080
MIIRFLHRPIQIPSSSILCFITTKLRLRPNLYSGTKFGTLSLNVRSMSASAGSSSRSPVLFSNKQVQQRVDSSGVLLLSGKEDEHGGVIVEMSTEEPVDPLVFGSLLKASMLHWKQQAG